MVNKCVAAVFNSFANVKRLHWVDGGIRTDQKFPVNLMRITAHVLLLLVMSGFIGCQLHPYMMITKILLMVQLCKSIPKRCEHNPYTSGKIILAKNNPPDV